MRSKSPITPNLREHQHLQGQFDSFLHPRLATLKKAIMQDRNNTSQIRNCRKASTMARMRTRLKIGNVDHSHLEWRWVSMTLLDPSKLDFQRRWRSYMSADLQLLWLYRLRPFHPTAFYICALQSPQIPSFQNLVTSLLHSPIFFPHCFHPDSSSLHLPPYL